MGKIRILDFVSYLPGWLLLIIHMRKQACTVIISSWEFLFTGFRHNCHWGKTGCVSLIQVYQTVHGISLEVNETHICPKGGKVFNNSRQAYLLCKMCVKNVYYKILYVSFIAVSN